MFHLRMSAICIDKNYKLQTDQVTDPNIGVEPLTSSLLMMLSNKLS